MISEFFTPGIDEICFDCPVKFGCNDSHPDCPHPKGEAAKKRKMTPDQIERNRKRSLANYHKRRDKQLAIA